MSPASLACQASRESNKLDSVTESTEKSTESAQKSSKLSKAFGIALCAFALSINGCAIIKTSKFEGTVIENAKANMNFPQNDCLNGQLVRYYSKSELSDLRSLINDQADAIASLSRFGTFSLPEGVTERVDASGVEVKSLGDGQYLLTYYNGYSEFGVGNSPRSEASEEEAGVEELAGAAADAIANTAQLANTATSLFGQLFGGKKSASSAGDSKSKNNREPDPAIQDYYTKASFGIEVSVLEGDKIGIKKIVKSNGVSTSGNIPHLGGSLEAIEEDVDNIIKNFKFGVKVDNVHKAEEGTIKTLFVRIKSVLGLLNKNGFKKDGKAEKKHAFSKYVKVGPGQDIRLNVGVDCPLNKNCDVKYETHVDYYNAYSDGKCSITGSNFGAVSSKAVAELRGILE